MPLTRFFVDNGCKDSIIDITPHSSEIDIIDLCSILQSWNCSCLNIFESNSLVAADKDCQVANLKINFVEINGNFLIETILLAIFAVPRMSDSSTLADQLVVVNCVSNGSDVID